MTQHSGIRDAARRAYLMVTRGTLVKATDSSKMQTLEVRGLFGERFKDVEHWHPYGFSTVPKAPDDHEAEVILLNLGGSASHQVAIATADRRHRLKDMQEGEVALHDDQGQKVHLSRSGPVVEAPAGKTITFKVGNQTMVLDQNGLTVNVSNVAYNKV